MRTPPQDEGCQGEGACDEVNHGADITRRGCLTFIKCNNLDGELFSELRNCDIE